MALMKGSRAWALGKKITGGAGLVLSVLGSRDMRRWWLGGGREWGRRGWGGQDKESADRRHKANTPTPLQAPRISEQPTVRKCDQNNAEQIHSGCECVCDCVLCTSVRDARGQGELLIQIHPTSQCCFPCTRMCCVLLRQSADCCSIKPAGQHELERPAGPRTTFMRIFWFFAPKLWRLIDVHHTALKLYYGANIFCCC